MAFKYGSNSSLSGADALVRGIGLFSIGLGVAELVAPGRIAKPLGLDGKEGLIRAFGLREIGSGIATLSTDPQPALWSRVAGDLLDLATLGWGARSADGPVRRNALMAMGAVAGIAALDAFAASLTGRRGGERPPPADYSDRSGLPLGVAASRGHYAQKRAQGPAIADRDARADRTHSGGAAAGDAGGDRGSASGGPPPVATDAGLPPLPAVSPTA